MRERHAALRKLICALVAGLVPCVSTTALGQQISALPGPVQPARQQLECSEVVVNAVASNWIFGDGFESGDTEAWGSPTGLFSVSAVVDLTVEVKLTGTAQELQNLHLRLETPKGHHYQTMTVPISSSSAAVGSMARVEGYPRPLPVQVVANDEGTAYFVFPIAGTSIATSSLYGQWIVRAYLDQETDPCATSSFGLIQ